VKHHIYGTATVNDKGQIVIPVEARKDLGIGPDAKLVIVGGMRKNVLHIVEAGAFERKMQGVMGWFFKGDGMGAPDSE
jgi:AbrB family looped-hinge helix DNA binding protein